MGERKQHRRTDPACVHHRQPRTRLGWWWFNHNRGRSCPLCVPPREELRRETMDAIYAEHDRSVDEPARDLVWVMSFEWFAEIRSMFRPAGYSSLNAGAGWKAAADRVLSDTMLGIPVEVRDDAGFPALVRREDVQ